VKTPPSLCDNSLPLSKPLPQSLSPLPISLFLSDIAHVLGLFYFTALLLIGMYAVMLLFFLAGWQQTQEPTLNKGYIPNTKVCVIIPARNEANNLPALLNNLKAQIFPPHLWELVVVDDHSTDNTPAIASSYEKVRLISLANEMGNEKIVAYKKKAIETAIQTTQADWIITLDADVLVGPWWLHSLVQAIEENKTKWIAGPVQFPKPKTGFEHFQLFDFLTMQGITAAVISTRSGVMCNGANLAYNRQAYHTVHGFENINQLASGDDMLLMQKIEARFPGQSLYLKQAEAIATTNYMPTLRDFLQQRIRWASKAKHFNDKKIQAILLLVFLCNFLWILLPLLCWLNIIPWLFFVAAMGFQLFIEWRLLQPVLRFFQQGGSFLRFMLLKFLHVPYILVSGFWGMFGSYTWKDRTVH